MGVFCLVYKTILGDGIVTFESSFFCQLIFRWAYNLLKRHFFYM